MSDSVEQVVETPVAVETVYSKVVDFLGTAYQGEGALDFMQTIAQKLVEASEEQWDALDEEVKEWYNDFVEKFSENHDSVEFVPPVLVGLAEAIVVYDAVEKPAKGKAPKAPKAPKAAKEPKAPKAPKAAKEPKAPKEPKVSLPSNSGTMREILAAKWNISLDDLMKELEEKEFVAKRSSAHIVWFNTQKTMELLIAKGSFGDKEGNTYKIVKA